MTSVEMNKTFENFTFNPFSNQEDILLNNNFDPDENFFNENTFLRLNAEYYSVEETEAKLSTIPNNSSFSIFHLNIRSITKNFENFKLFLSKCAYEFSIICLTETWCTDESFLNDSDLQLPKYNSNSFGKKK